MAVSSVSITQVNLYAEAARSGRGERRERPSHDCEPCQPRPAAARANVLADAMRDAFEALGWSRTTDVAADADDDAAPASGGPAASLDEAMAGFATALAEALKDVRRSRSGGEGEGGGGRGWSRGMGMAPRIEVLAVQVQISAGSPAEAAAPAPSPAPVAAPVSQLGPIEPAVLPVPVESVATAPAPAAEPDAAVAVAPAPVPAADEPLIVAPPPAPEKPSTLVDAFKNLLDSLRDNGVRLGEADEPASTLLVRFLNQLADSLGARPGSSRFDTQPVFRGTFVSLVA